MFHSDYIAPHSLEELLTILEKYGEEAKVIAGGTDLVPQMRLGKLSPRVLVDPVHLPLPDMDATNGSFHLGARLTHGQVLVSTLLKNTFPALVSACQQVGGPPVRNRGTLAGNLVNASPAADSALPLLVYDAQIIAASMDGKRAIPLCDFFTGPGKTNLAINEFVEAIQIPRLPPHSRAAFLKLGNRKAMAIAVASVAVRLTLDDGGKVSLARIALGSVAPVPVRAYHAEAILQSEPSNEETIQLAARAAQEAASPISDLRASAEYRRKMVYVLTRRALEKVHQELTPGVNYG